MGWEGIMAKQRGLDLNVFEVSPYGYSPCLLAANKFIVPGSDDNDALRRFLRATAKGYQLAHSSPEVAADALMNVADHDSLRALGRDFVLEAQQYLSNHQCILNERGQWGAMDPAKWTTFVDFLTNNRLLTGPNGMVVNKDDLKPEDLYDNSFLL